jgi:hypothetical protein
VAIAALSVPFVAADVSALRFQWNRVHEEALRYGPELETVLQRAGGPERINACGTVFTGIFDVTAVAWHLHLHGNQLGIFPFGPGTTMAGRDTHLAADPRYPRVIEYGQWAVGSTCR